MLVLVSGGGIGGLTLAIALQQRQIACTVYEGAPADRSQGAGLMLAPNALEVLDRLGLASALRDVGHEPAAMGLWLADGTRLQETRADDWLARYGRRPLALDRNRLHRLLLAQLAPGTVVYDRRVVDFRQEAAGVRVRFADGGEASGDLLVGADGVRSAVRARLCGPARLRYSGQTSWRGISRHLVDGGPLAGKLAELWGRERGHRFGMVPVDEQRTYWFATRYAPAGGSDVSGAAALAELRAAHRDYPPEVDRVLDGSAPAELVRTDIVDFAPLSSWHRGRVVLVGDAAHATTPNMGQGACQAIESAYVLAQELAARPYAEAFTRYQAIRMAKAHFVTHMSWRFGQLSNAPGPLGRWLRQRVIARTPARLIQKQTDRLFRLDY